MNFVAVQLVCIAKARMHLASNGMDAQCMTAMITRQLFLCPIMLGNTHHSCLKRGMHYVGVPC